LSETATLRRYTEEEDNLILQSWYDKNQREALAQKLDRPLGGLAYRFYQLLKERNLDPKEYRRLAKQGRLQNILASEPSPQEETPGVQAAPQDDLLEALKYFPDQARKLERELELIKAELAQIREERVGGLPEFLNSFKKIDELRQENLRLKDRLAELEAERETLLAQVKSKEQALEEERKELRQVYDDLEAIFSEFMRLSSVDKIRVLGDFAARLEVTVDKFGNVVKLRRSV